MFRQLYIGLAVTMSFCAQAQTAEQLLQSKLAAISSFSASFEQHVFDAQQQIVQKGKGELMLKQPALFRFETSEPEANLFIGDGDSLWFYNPVLEQLTIYDAAREVDRTPFALLTSSNPALWAKYNVSQQGEQFIIASKEPDSPVTQLSLRFVGDALSSMSVVDVNQQRSEFNFTVVQLNVALDEGLFQFTPPEYTDIDDQRP